MYVYTSKSRIFEDGIQYPEHKAKRGHASFEFEYLTKLYSWKGGKAANNNIIVNLKELNSIESID